MYEIQAALTRPYAPGGKLGNFGSYTGPYMSPTEELGILPTTLLSVAYGRLQKYIAGVLY